MVIQPASRRWGPKKEESASAGSMAKLPAKGTVAGPRLAREHKGIFTWESQPAERDGAYSHAKDSHVQRDEDTIQKSTPNKSYT